MPRVQQSKIFAHEFNAGPVETEEELRGDWKTGNCRRAVQWYVYDVKGIFLKPEQILLPQAYHLVGEFVYKEPPVNFNALLPADIIYAERVRDSKGNSVNYGRDAFTDVETYILHLHTALYVGNQQIWHATAIEGASCFWLLEKFLHFYEPVAVKRI